MMRDKTFTLFDAVTGVPAQLHYHDVFAIEWHGHHKLNFERAIIGYKSGARMELFMSKEDANSVRSWMQNNGAVHTILTSGIPQPEVEQKPTPPTNAYPVPVFAEKRELGGERRKGPGTYIGKDRRQGDRRYRGEEND
jgi:hypothetical protein